MEDDRELEEACATLEKLTSQEYWALARFKGHGNYFNEEVLSRLVKHDLIWKPFGNSYVLTTKGRLVAQVREVNKKLKAKVLSCSSL